MAANPNPPAAERITGTVASVNPKGLKLRGEDEWRNFSKFAPDLEPPERGQSVVLTLDKAGFVRDVQPADGASAAPSMQQTSVSRDQTITRLAVLKAAAEFAASRPEATSRDVLKVAELWEAWVTRAD